MICSLDEAKNTVHCEFNFSGLDSNTILDFQSDPIIDTEVSSTSYLSAFKDINAILNSNDDTQINSNG